MYTLMISNMWKLCWPVLKFKVQGCKGNNQGLVNTTSIVHNLMKVASFKEKGKHEKFDFIVTLIWQH